MNIEQLESTIINLLDDMKAIDVISIDVQELTTITDKMIICSGNSPRHVKAITRNLLGEIKKLGVQSLGMEGEQDGEWILIDLGDILVHVMQEKIREFYNLEKLWSVPANSE